MSVAFLKRLLFLAKLFAVLLIAGTAWGYLGHRDAMRTPPGSVQWTLKRNFAPVEASQVRSISVPLGRYPQAKPEPVETQPKEEPKRNIETVLDQMGEIVNAFVVYGPYRPGDPVPSILFRFKDETKRVIARGEALEERPHPSPELADAGYTVPVRYQFVGCIPDPEHEGWTLFEFRMDPDGDEIQRARWKGESDDKPLIAEGQLPERKGWVSQGGIFIGDPDDVMAEAEARAREAGAATPQPGPDRVEPVRPAPANPVAPQPGRLVQREGDAISMTSEGAQYLEENYERVLEDVSFDRYEDRASGRSGVLVRRILPGSQAAQFGIRDDDVILSINGAAVRDRDQAVTVVKRELNKSPRPRYLEVRILRNGREVTERYDTEDPDTRRRARDLR